MLRSALKFIVLLQYQQVSVEEKRGNSPARGCPVSLVACCVMGTAERGVLLWQGHRCGALLFENTAVGTPLWGTAVGAVLLGRCCKEPAVGTPLWDILAGGCLLVP